MRKIRGLLRACPGANPTKRLQGSQTVSHGSSVDPAKKSLPPLLTPRHTRALPQRYLSSRQFRRQHDHRRVPHYPQPGNWLQGRASVRIHAVQRRSHREGS